MICHRAWLSYLLLSVRWQVELFCLDLEICCERSYFHSLAPGWEWPDKFFSPFGNELPEQISLDMSGTTLPISRLAPIRRLLRRLIFLGSPVSKNIFCIHVWLATIQLISGYNHLLLLFVEVLHVLIIVIQLVFFLSMIQQIMLVLHM
jgi:hypothetical protein